MSEVITISNILKLKVYHHYTNHSDTWESVTSQTLTSHFATFSAPLKEIENIEDVGIHKEAATKRDKMEKSAFCSLLSPFIWMLCSVKNCLWAIWSSASSEKWFINESSKNVNEPRNATEGRQWNMLRTVSKGLWTVTPRSWNLPSQRPRSSVGGCKESGALLNARNLNQLKQCCREKWAKMSPQKYEWMIFQMTEA